MKAIEKLRKQVLELNSKSKSAYIDEVFNNYINDDLPPLPGLFEDNSDLAIIFPDMDYGQLDKAYNRMNKSTYEFHNLDRETLLYKNQENHFRYHGYYEIAK